MTEGQGASLVWLARLRCAELASSGASPAERLTDALLRRGYLVGRDGGGDPFLARGSHPVDRGVLADILHMPLGRARDGRVSPVAPTGNHLDEAIEQILSLPEHQVGMTADGMTGPWRSNRYLDWRDCRRRAFGTQLAVAGDRQYGALDIGVALLVKALPIVGVSTSYSCDGHGVRPARIGLFTKWDVVWCEILLEHLRDRAPATASTVAWCINSETLSIDGPTAAVLDDIQRAARQLLDPDMHRPLRAARQCALADPSKPDMLEWTSRLSTAMDRHFPQRCIT